MPEADHQPHLDLARQDAARRGTLIVNRPGTGPRRGVVRGCHHAPPSSPDALKGSVCFPANRVGVLQDLGNDVDAVFDLEVDQMR